jgi:RNase P subunit RPR2
MKRTCADCRRVLLVKDTAREWHDWRTGETRYRCRECATARVWLLIERTRDALGLQARP